MSYDEIAFGLTPGIRLYRTVRAAREYGGNNTTLNMWTHVFGIVEEDMVVRSRKVTEILHVLQDQLSAVFVAAESNSRLDKDDYEDELEAVREILSTGILPHTWQQYQVRISDGVLKTLLFIGRHSTQDSSAASDTDIEELLRLIQELEDSVRTGEHDNDLKYFLFSLVDTMRRAVREYPYRGAAAFSNAVYEIEFKVQDNPEASRKAEEAKSLPALRRAWVAFVQVARKVQSAEKVLRAAASIAQILGSIAHSLHLPIPPEVHLQLGSGQPEKGE